MTKRAKNTEQIIEAFAFMIGNFPSTMKKIVDKNELRAITLLFNDTKELLLFLAVLDVFCFCDKSQIEKNNKKLKAIKSEKKLKKLSKIRTNGLGRPNDARSIGSRISWTINQHINKPKQNRISIRQKSTKNKGPHIKIEDNEFAVLVLKSYHDRSSCPTSKKRHPYDEYLSKLFHFFISDHSESEGADYVEDIDSSSSTGETSSPSSTFNTENDEIMSDEFDSDPEIFPSIEIDEIENDISSSPSDKCVHCPKKNEQLKKQRVYITRQKTFIKNINKKIQEIDDLFNKKK